MISISFIRNVIWIFVSLFFYCWMYFWYETLYILDILVIFYRLYKCCFLLSVQTCSRWPRCLRLSASCASEPALLVPAFWPSASMAPSLAACSWWLSAHLVVSCIFNRLQHDFIKPLYTLVLLFASMCACFCLLVSCLFACLFFLHESSFNYHNTINIITIIIFFFKWIHSKNSRDCFWSMMSKFTWVGYP